MSPEHEYLKKWKDQIENWARSPGLHGRGRRKSDLERTDLSKEKTGVPSGHRGREPRQRQHIPIFVSDYVLITYGTGIVMGVPGHDQRDWDFATKFGLPIVEVVEGGDITKEAFTLKDDTGIMVNSGFLNGMTVKEAIPAMKKWVT
jgi:leucyl-tRNA synthetase